MKSDADVDAVPDLPLLYHIDAWRYGEELTALLDDIAHLGISRKSFSKFLANAVGFLVLRQDEKCRCYR